MESEIPKPFRNLDMSYFQNKTARLTAAERNSQEYQFHLAAAMTPRIFGSRAVLPRGMSKLGAFSASKLKAGFSGLPGSRLHSRNPGNPSMTGCCGPWKTGSLVLGNSRGGATSKLQTLEDLVPWQFGKHWNPAFDSPKVHWTRDVSTKQFGFKN